MKNSSFLITLLALALVFVTYKWVDSTSAAPAVTTDTVPSTTLDDILMRTSVRSYSDRKVDSLTVDTLLRAAMAAPTAGNKQPWRFVVVTDTASLNYIASNFRSMKMAAEAQVAVVMCGDVTATFEGEGREYWVQDVSAATENLLLAAHSVGLGAVWCGIYPISERVNEFTTLLKLPENIIPMACVCVGYPAVATTPKDKWVPEYIRYNTWE
ncbi:MAG: nitroreductase family protein [Duncaniella sp.]|nr:nitroreductase family protein [Duncaniella sp.]